jgi:hypothetical protein
VNYLFFVLISFLSFHCLANDELLITSTTWLKSTTGQASTLPDSQRCQLKKGEKYPVTAIHQKHAHFFVELGKAPSGCPFSEGYVFQGHVTFSGNLTQGMRLQMPYYFYQWYNRNLPGSTCGMTSAAMLLSYHLKKKITPDEIYRRYGSHGAGQSPEGLANIYRDYGAKASSTRFGSFDKIKAHLNRGEPVVVHGYFTSGHILLISGYTPSGFVVQDPAGNWNRRNYGGYPNAPHDPQAGNGVVYTYQQMRGAIIEPSDNSLWMSWISLD